MSSVDSEVVSSFRVEIIPCRILLLRHSTNVDMCQESHDTLASQATVSSFAWKFPDNFGLDVGLEVVVCIFVFFLNF